MATNRTIAATETDPGAPLVSALFKALDANNIAQAEGAVNAPKTVSDALDTFLGDFDITTTPAGLTGFSARLKKLLIHASAVGLNSSGTSSGLFTLQIRTTSDNGATWSGYTTVANFGSLVASGGTEKGQGVIILDLVTGAWRSTVYANLSGTLATNINGIQLRTNVASGTATSSGGAIVHGIAGVSP